MLFAQLQAPPTAPTAPTPAEVRSADPRTTRSSGDTAARPRDPNDTRTTRDEGYEAPVPAPQPSLNQYDPAFGASPSVRAAARAAEETGAVFVAGGLDYGTQVALIEGYNDNVVQTQDATDAPITRHPSPFTGLDLEVNMRAWSGPVDPHEFRLQLRGQHYTPLDGYDQPDDGTITGAYAGQFTLGQRDVLFNHVMGTVSTLNSSRLSDGPLFMVEPASLQRTFTVVTARSMLMHELSPRTRYAHGVDVGVGATLHDAPTLNGSELIEHRGLDFIQPGTDGTLYYDVNTRDMASVRVSYQQLRNSYVLDYTRQPPSYGGVATTHLGELSAGFSHAFSEVLHGRVGAGVSVATAPPLDEDQSAIVSPTASSELVSTKQYWTVGVNASYTYGAASPRLGFGPALTGGAMLQGYPFPHTYVLRDLAVLATAAASRASFRATQQTSRLSYVTATLEGRYAVNRWLGIVFGYDFRYATFEGVEAIPSLLRNMVFVGVSGYWNTDRSLPLLTTFQAPVGGM